MWEIEELIKFNTYFIHVQAANSHTSHDYSRVFTVLFNGVLNHLALLVSGLQADFASQLLYMTIPSTQMLTNQYTIQ